MHKYSPRMDSRVKHQCRCASISRKARKATQQFEGATFTGAVSGHSSSSSVAVAGNGQLILARGGYPRLILLSASRADDLMTPEHCALNLHRDRDVHATQFQHHVIPRYWATECDGCPSFHPIGNYVPARTCSTAIPREFPTLCMVWISPEHGHALNQRTRDVSPMLCLQIRHSHRCLDRRNAN